MSEIVQTASVPEDSSSLIQHQNALDVDAVVGTLRRDLVCLLRNVDPKNADNTIEAVATELGLLEKLELQAGFAAVLGHRHNVGKYFMTVNKREESQFIPPHSEGSSRADIQMSAFFCFENTTDGGETILMQVNDASPAWSCLRERVRRTKCAPRKFSAHELALANSIYRVRLNLDFLRDDDEVLKEYQTKIPGLVVADVLTRPIRAFSTILGRDTYVYWDSIGSIDFDSATEYFKMLKSDGMLKSPLTHLSILDNANPQRIWRSGTCYREIFNKRITCKLTAGDLIIFNNLSWVHSANNWTPGSGDRQMAASFA
jgi:hypothetical protein